MCVRVWAIIVFVVRLSVRTSTKLIDCRSRRTISSRPKRLRVSAENAEASIPSTILKPTIFSVPNQPVVLLGGFPLFRVKSGRPVQPCSNTNDRFHRIIGRLSNIGNGLDPIMATFVNWTREEGSKFNLWKGNDLKRRQYLI